MKNIQKMISIVEGAYVWQSVFQMYSGYGTHIQPRIGLLKSSYTAATLSNRVVLQIIILLNTKLLIVVNFKFACVYLIINIIHNIA